MFVGGGLALFLTGRISTIYGGSMRGLDVKMVDEHYYKSPDWFLKNAGRYDNVRS